MTTMDVGKKLVELCKQGKNDEAIATLYSGDIVSVEAGAPPGKDPVTKGLDGVKGKSAWWADNHTVHSATVDGPFPNGDRFIVKFVYDITFKPENRRFTMEEMALYTVNNGKVVREEFFYAMG